MSYGERTYRSPGKNTLPLPITQNNKRKITTDEVNPFSKSHCMYTIKTPANAPEKLIGQQPCVNIVLNLGVPCREQQPTHTNYLNIVKTSTRSCKSRGIHVNDRATFRLVTTRDGGTIWTSHARFIHAKNPWKDANTGLFLNSSPRKSESPC